MPDETPKPDDTPPTTKKDGQADGDTIPRAVVPAAAAFIGGLLGAIVGSTMA